MKKKRSYASHARALETLMHSRESRGELPAIRIAIRTEEGWVVAYLARPDTMDGAVRVAVIHRAVVEMSPSIFDLWKGALSEWLRLVTAEAMGIPAETARTKEQAPRADA